VKKLRRKQISSQAQANVYLERDYLPEHNGRFARVAAKPEDYHRRAPRATELERIFRVERERTISEDWVVRYENRFFQLGSRPYAPAEGKVTVCEGRHGSITIAAGQANDEQTTKPKNKKGDVSNEVRQGTFLSSFDMCGQSRLTCPGARPNISRQEQLLA
jgi:hypothetical protein